MDDKWGTPILGNLHIVGGITLLALFVSDHLSLAHRAPGQARCHAWVWHLAALLMPGDNVWKLPTLSVNISYLLICMG
jgi:hypothetical protein